MATVNAATKYSPKVDEAFKSASFTEAAFNQDYDWDGVSSINVYGVTTTALNDYVRGGKDRYGDTNEQATSKTTYTLARDRAFSFTIDKRNNAEQMGVLEAGKALRRQIDEQVIPETDIYRLQVLGTAATANSANVNTGASSSANAWTNFLLLNERLSDRLVPITGRIAFCTYTWYNLLKQTSAVLASDKGQETRHTGSLGFIENVELIQVPSSYMPASTDVIITHPVAAVAPKILNDYTTHDNPPGISGTLVEGRVVYDAFVLTSKVGAVAAHKTA